MKKALLCLSLAASLGCGGAHKEQPSAAAAPEVVTPPPDVDAFRNAVPSPGPAPALHAPVPTKTALDNGLTVLSVTKSALPLVSVSVIIRSGSAQDPKGLDGLAGFTAEMLKAGTTTRNSEAIADEVETRGASIEVDADEDAITLTTTALKENFGAVFDILADVLQHPTFDAKEIERTRSSRIAGLSQADDNPQTAATKVFRKVLYGAHPYGHTPLGSEASLKKIKAKDLKAYFKEHFRPQNAAVVIIGDVSSADATTEVQKRLGGWKGSGKVQAPPPAPTAQDPEVTLVPRAGAPQSQLMIGELGVSRADPDYFGIVLTNAILGGLFNSRINMNLREAHGYTYGARSYFDYMRERGPFFVATGVRTDVTDKAITEVLKEINGIRDGEVAAEELQNAKSRYTLSLPGYFQTVDGVAGMVGNIYLFDLPLDYYQVLPERINAITIADIKRIAQAHLHPDKLTIVVVGDKNLVEAGLGDLKRGPLHLRDNEGNLVKK